AADWAGLSRIALSVLTARPRKRRFRPPRLASIVGAAMLACLIHGCTTMRILRHRDPAADRPRVIFSQRVVHAAERPSRWVVARPRYVDFDTVVVRDVDLQMRPLAEY